MQMIPCVLDHDCPSRRTLTLLADKWALLVIAALKQGTMRNGELKRRLGDVSQKMLTQTLRELETCGLVERIVYHEVPPRVEYRLTELGLSLHEPISALARWAEEHFPEVEAARARSARETVLQPETLGA
jgi:DNA-binding HxlR family transcriptional regulator